MDDKQLPLNKDRTVRIDNELVRAPWEIVPLSGQDVSSKKKRATMPVTPIQAKLIRMLVAAIDQSTGHLHTYECKVSELIKFLGVPKKAYSNIDDIVNQMLNIRTRFVIKNESGYVTETRWVSWVSTAVIKRSEENSRDMQLVVRLNDDLVEHITALSAYFTTYQLGSILSLPNEPSLRLYEYIMSHRSLIEEYNLSGKGYPVPMRDLREMLGWDVYDTDGKTSVSYVANKDSVRRIEELFKIINERTDLHIQNATAKRHGEYYFDLYVSMQDLPGKEPTRKIAEASYQDRGNKSVYVANLLQYYSQLLGRPGKRMERKLEQCFDDGVKVGYIREAFEYSRQQKLDGVIKSSVEAYTRKMIDAVIEEKIPVKNENLQVYPYDPLTKFERTVFGTAQSMSQQQKNIIDCVIPMYDLRNAPDFVVYVSSISLFCQQRHLPKMDYRFYRSLQRWFEAGLDIRYILSGIVRTEFQYNPYDTERKFNFYKYATRVIKNSQMEDKPFEKVVEHMTLDWLRNNS